MPPSVNAYPDEVTAVVSEYEVIMVEVEGTGPQGAMGGVGLGGTMTSTLIALANDNTEERVYNIKKGTTPPSDPTCLWVDTTI